MVVEDKDGEDDLILSGLRGSASTWLLGRGSFLKFVDTFVVVCLVEEVLGVSGDRLLLYERRRFRSLLYWLLDELFTRFEGPLLRLLLRLLPLVDEEVYLESSREYLSRSR